jgi:hypothetical protein
LLSNVGNANTAVGAGALLNNTTGVANSATGANALAYNTTGVNNTATGELVLYRNTTGSDNTASGLLAMYSNTTGNTNTAIGELALQGNTTGNNNIALGYTAGVNLTTGDGNIDIGNQAFEGEAATIRIGDEAVQTATYIAGISGQTASGGVAVFINSDGKLGTLTSSARFKTEIKPMDESSETILALKPVTFRYKHEIDPRDIPQFGLVAEDVEKVNPALVIRDRDGKPYAVRYEAVNAMLLNEFLKEHRRNEKLEATVAHQQKQIDALTAGLQKVSAKIETSKPAPQVVNNNQ